MAYLRKKGKNYFVVFYHRGRRYEKSCKTTHRQIAEGVRKHVEEEVASRTFKIEKIELGALKLLDEYVEQYLSYSRSNKSKKTVGLDTMALRKMKEFTGNVPIDSISTEQLERLKSKLLTEYSPTSVNMIIRSLRAAFAKALLWNFIDSNPMKVVDYVRIPDEEGPFMTKEDIEKLRGVMKPGLYCDLIETALYTGMRVGEIVNLKWSDIDFINLKIRVRNTDSFSTKSGKERTVPLHPRLADILSLRSQVDHLPFVFMRPDMEQVRVDTASKKYRKYCKRAGLDPRFHFHTLRHTFASHLAMSGVSLYFIQKILGHQSIETTTKTYAHLQPEPLVHAVKQLGY